MKKMTLAVDIDGTITENGGGRINLNALHSLRYVRKLGHNVIFVSGRSSVEGYLLAVYGGLNTVAVGENGGCITQGPNDHTLLGDKKKCLQAFSLIQSKLNNVVEKPVFPRMTEVVLQRTFDINDAKRIVQENGMDVILSDSQYAIHINSSGIDKSVGLKEVMKRLQIPPDDLICIGDSETDIPMFKVAKLSIAVGNASDEVKSQAGMIVTGNAGDGVIEALEKIIPTILES
ncbi:MAG TPA: phosphoglycolate phosphatase [Candidatus Nitrosotenuis sp.]|nr:phosphoglycolate phosphatase [Candidatus Nitrosotenuis sp.]